MGVMTKMRSAMPVVIIGAVVMFVALIVLEWGMDISGMNRGRVSSSEKLGSVNGKDISYKDFEAEVTSQKEQQQQQQQNPEAPDDEKDAQLRDFVWDHFVTNALMTGTLQKLDVDVTDDEVRDILIDDPPSYLRKQFTDSLNNFDLAAYQNVISQIANYQGTGQTDQEKRMDTMYKSLLQIEDGVRMGRQQEKFQSIISATVLITEAEIQQKFYLDNARADIAYVAFDEASIPNELVAVSDDEMKAYYDKHPEEFVQAPSRKIKYTFMFLMASMSDSMSVIKKLQTLVDSLHSGQDTARHNAAFQQYMTRYNELETQNDAFLKLKDMDLGKAVQLLSTPVGGYSGLVGAADGFHVYQVVEDRQGEDPHVRYQQIVLPYGFNKDSVKTVALQMIDKLNDHKASDYDQTTFTFETVAGRASFDHASAVRGGDMGYAGKGGLPKPLEDVLFSAPIGKVVGPVATDAGYVVLRVNERNNREVRVKDLKMTVHISSQTRQISEHQGQDLRDRVAKGENFDSTAAHLKLRVFESQMLQRNTPFLGSLQFTQWVFNGKQGDVSEPKKLRGNSVVLFITEVRQKGVKPFDEVKSAIKQKITHQKKLDNLSSKAQALVSVLRGDSLEHASRLDTNLHVQFGSGITPKGDLPGGGADYAIGAAVFGLQNTNQMSDPVRGNRGVYVVQLRQKALPSDSMYVLQKEVIRNTLQQQRKSGIFQSWIDKLKETGKIEDNREKFFRN